MLDWSVIIPSKECCREYLRRPWALACILFASATLWVISDCGIGPPWPTGVLTVRRTGWAVDADGEGPFFRQDEAFASRRLPGGILLRGLAASDRRVGDGADRSAGTQAGNH